MGLVARLVVGVALRPASGIDCGDAGHRVEGEGARARQRVVDAGETAVGPVTVAAALEGASVLADDRLGGESAGEVVLLGEGEARAHGTGQFPTGCVSFEGECAACGAQCGAAAEGVVSECEGARVEVRLHCSRPVASYA